MDDFFVVVVSEQFIDAFVSVLHYASFAIPGLCQMVTRKRSMATYYVHVCDCSFGDSSIPETCVENAETVVIVVRHSSSKACSRDLHKVNRFDSIVLDWNRVFPSGAVIGDIERTRR